MKVDFTMDYKSLLTISGCVLNLMLQNLAAILYTYAKLNTKLLFLIFITKRKMGENQLWIFIFIFILSQEINPRLPLSSLSFFSDGKCNGMRHDTVIVFQGPFFRISLFFSTRVENRSVTTKNTTRPEIIFCQWPLNKP